MNRRITSHSNLVMSAGSGTASRYGGSPHQLVGSGHIPSGGLVHRPLAPGVLKLVSEDEIGRAHV